MPDDGAVSCVLAKVDTEAGREVVRALDALRSTPGLARDARGRYSLAK